MAIEGIPMPDGRPAFLLVDGRRETRRKMGEAGKSLGRGATARTRKPASLSIRREPSGRNKPATCSGSKTERYRHGRRTVLRLGHALALLAVYQQFRCQ